MEKITRIGLKCKKCGHEYIVHIGFYLMDTELVTYCKKCEHKAYFTPRKCIINT